MNSQDFLNQLNAEAVESLREVLDELLDIRDEQRRLIRVYEEADQKGCAGALACAAGKLDGIELAIQRIDEILTHHLAQRSPGGGA